MKKVYIVLTYTGTALSRIVRVCTRKKYCHVSISLDRNLRHMYSFGRVNPYIPFIGGFVQESPEYGTFKRFKNTKAKIYELEVSEEDYKKIKDIIKDFKAHKGNYRFNVIGLIAVLFHLNPTRDNHYYCAEFVKHLLVSSNLNVDLPVLIKPEDFRNLDGSSCIYTGLLRDYRI